MRLENLATIAAGLNVDRQLFKPAFTIYKKRAISGKLGKGMHEWRTNVSLLQNIWHMQIVKQKRP